MGRSPILLTALILTACAVPIKPVTIPPAPASYLRSVPTAGTRLQSAWWRGFADPSLDHLVALGERRSPTVAAADALVAQAAANQAAATGVFLPQVSLNPNVSRQSFPTGPNGYGAYTIDEFAGAITYNPGLFGARSYAFRNGRALAAYQRANAAAARLTLADNIVVAAITEAGLEAQIATDRAMAASEQRLLTLLQGEYAAGAIARLPVLQQQAQVQATMAALPGLLAQASAQRHALAVLSGVAPADFAGGHFRLTDFTVPADSAASVPSALVAGRPDIMAARALVSADHAAVGQAVAALYPSLTLSAQGGYASETFNTLFEPSAALWTLAGSLLAPIFDGGVLHAHEAAARATLANALATYRSTVLTAFQQVADGLRRTADDRDSVAESNAAAATADDAYTLARQQFKLGAASYNTVLTAQITWRQAQLTAVQAATQQLLDQAALGAALAGE
ncbi:MULTISPECIES: efflux transporter outer membrane subunit [Acidiphilium]|uniref:efflux transporter outer membrane subunit n=1 Tax=Acidiphilium TaxID=522 RepID=UPI00257B5632|nr:MULTISPECIES: efflux transporter outer membrane subunit [Acidiphilium]HQT84132.1 efflux transporter outer membrane subunit [Acidiphilium rubrum]